jgi:RNA polymerase sigma-70 factor, ECF subfamily
MEQRMSQQGRLVVRWQNSTVGTFEQLYAEYQPAVQRYLLGMSSNPVLAEELTQEVFVRAAANLLLFRGEATVNTWLFRIARNVYLSWVERQRDAEIDTEEFHAIPDGGAYGDPEAHLLQTEQRATIRRAMAMLPERQRTLLLLRDLQGLSYAEIALVLEQSLAAVKVNLHRARLQFREIYLKLEGTIDE